VSTAHLSLRGAKRRSNPGAWIASTLFCLCLAMTISSKLSAYLVDGFDMAKTKVVKERSDFVGGGKPKSRIPFVKSYLTKDTERGNVLSIEFNVSEGYGGTFLKFYPRQISPQFDAVRFWIRGAQSAFKIELKDDLIHSFVIEKSERNIWQQLTIPVSSLSNHEQLKKDKISEFVFVFEEGRTAPRLGTIHIDDLELIELDQIKENASSLAKPGPVMINGDVPLNTPYEVGENTKLKLSTRVPRRGTFQEFRFEASWDDKNWFYLAGFPDQNKLTYEYEWPVGGFLSGEYLLRSVTVNAHGERKESAVSAIAIRNHFNFERFLEEVQRSAFDYFVYEVESGSYFVKDRQAPNEEVFSTGLSGFQMPAYVIGVERGWMKKEEALKRIHRLMDNALNQLNRYQGLLPHWLGTGRKEIWEIGMGDVVETSYFLAGALTAKQYFNHSNPEERSLRDKVDQFYKGIEWNSLLRRKKKEDEHGLIPWHWSKNNGPATFEVRGYNEAMIVYLLAMGAPENSIPPASWKAWASTYQKSRYGQYEVIACAPLFTHQYSHLWIDFRGIRDSYANYFDNSIQATLANREFSLKANQYPAELWGLTASEGPGGYKAYGAPPTGSSVPILNDGTIAPTASATSVMFTPPVSIAAMKYMKDNYGEKIWGKYGFKDAINPNKNWASEHYLGLDQGPIVLAIENYRTGLIWKLFMQNEEIQNGLKKAGFQPDDKNPAESSELPESENELVEESFVK